MSSPDFEELFCLRVDADALLLAQDLAALLTRAQKLMVCVYADVDLREGTDYHLEWVRGSVHKYLGIQWCTQTAAWKVVEE